MGSTSDGADVYDEYGKQLTRFLAPYTYTTGTHMEDAMKISMYVISVLWIVTGASLVIYTERAKEVLPKNYSSAKVKLLALIPFVIGVILVIGAFSCTKVFWLALVLGFLAMAKGLYLVFGPSSQIKVLWDWWFLKADDRTIRLFGLISLVIGIALLSRLN